MHVLNAIIITKNRECEQEPWRSWFQFFVHLLKDIEGQRERRKRRGTRSTSRINFSLVPIQEWRSILVAELFTILCNRYKGNLVIAIFALTIKAPTSCFNVNSENRMMPPWTDVTFIYYFSPIRAFNRSINAFSPATNRIMSPWNLYNMYYLTQSKQESAKRGSPTKLLKYDWHYHESIGKCIGWKKIYKIFYQDIFFNIFIQCFLNYSCPT